jgi:hypothetical protein
MKIAKRTFLFVGLLTFASTFVLGVFVTRLGTFKSACVRMTPWQVLVSFENQDLQGLDEESKRKVEAVVNAITGQRDEQIFKHFEPTLFRLTANTKGEKRYVLVELNQISIIPGNSYLRVHVFDTAGRVLDVQEFNAGYRTNVTSMRMRKTNPAKHQLLIVDAEYCLGGHPSTQYYALTADRMELVYLEQDGRVDNNNYHTSHMTIGPQVERSFGEWEKALRSSEEVEVLSALVWLNGHVPLPFHEKVQNRLQELSQSENFFIKTSAQSVLENNK